TPVSSAAQRIRLRSPDAPPLQFPAEITIPANQPGVTFDLDVRDDDQALGTRVATIIAEAIATDGTVIPNATTTAILSILDNDGPTLSLETANPIFSETGSTQLTVIRNTPPTNSVTVTLSLTPAGQATMPASVVLQTGMARTNVTVSGVADNISDGARDVTITASAPGFNSGQAVLTVTDIDVPDLSVTEISGPTNALT